MQRFGTVYGGWNLPEDAAINTHSIVYSAGVGEDVSFDLLLQEKYGCQIVLIDPTHRSKTHFEEIQSYFATHKWSFSGDIQRDYFAKINGCTPDFSKFSYLEKGLWSNADILKFYKPTNSKYVSHTLIENMYSREFETVNVDSVKNIMTALGHSHIDLLKMDIEGAEIVVLEQMLADKVYPKYLCVEFDLFLKGRDNENKTSQIISKLQTAGYKMVENDGWNCLFVLNS
jgi:FkbM family methyltransferase